LILHSFWAACDHQAKKSANVNNVPVMILAFIAEEAAGVEITPEQCGFSNSSRPVYDKGLAWNLHLLPEICKCKGRPWYLQIGLTL